MEDQQDTPEGMNVSKRPPGYSSRLKSLLREQKENMQKNFDPRMFDPAKKEPERIRWNK